MPLVQQILTRRTSMLWRSLQNRIGCFERLFELPIFIEHEKFLEEVLFLRRELPVGWDSHRLLPESRHERVQAGWRKGRKVNTSTCFKCPAAWLYWEL